ncbi:MAG: hypothetical protein Q9210_004945, partial [Variospora velana]
RVSTPSGMMTIREVPTRTPMPMVEMSCSRDWESEKDKGREPARKDLYIVSVKLLIGRTKDVVRNCHDRAQGEQHEQSVKHLKGAPLFGSRHRWQKLLNRIGLMSPELDYRESLDFVHGSAFLGEQWSDFRPNWKRSQRCQLRDKGLARSA